MNTLGGIGAILGAMLLAKMGSKNEEELEGEQGAGGGVEVRKMKELSPSTPNTPLDVQAMMSKHAPGAPMTNENINRVMDSAPKESTMLPRGTGPLDPRGPSPSIDPISIDQLTGKKQTFSVPSRVSDAVDRGMQQESLDRGDEYRAGPAGHLPMQEDMITNLLNKMRSSVTNAAASAAKTVGDNMWPDKTRNPYYKKPKEKKRVMDSAPRTEAKFEPITEAQLTGDPLMQHKMRYNNPDVGPSFDMPVENKYNVGHPGQNNKSGGGGLEKLGALMTAQDTGKRGSEYRTGTKRTYEAAPPNPKDQEPSIMKKFISEVLRGYTPSAEEQYTKRQ